MARKVETYTIDTTTKTKTGRVKKSWLDPSNEYYKDLQKLKKDLEKKGIELKIYKPRKKSKANQKARKH